MAPPRAPRSIFLRGEDSGQDIHLPAPRVARGDTMLGLAAFSIAFGARLLVAASPPPAVRHHEHHLETAQQVISALNLSANPEKGYYAQTYASCVNVTFVAATANGALYTSTRPASTLIYYLLTGDDGDSLWHRHDADEVWHHYAGAPLRLETSWDKANVSGGAVILGADVAGGGGEAGQQKPQAVVGAWEWQRARSLGAWTLVGTTVAPAFNETGYEIQQQGWEPQGA